MPDQHVTEPEISCINSASESCAQPPAPCPSLPGAFRQCAELLDNYTADERSRIIRALAILFEVQP